ncbi:MAG: hypothetical protein AAF591_08470 [Verrucomicrobiota bacterium]
MRSPKGTSLMVSLGVHLLLIVGLVAFVIPGARPGPPRFVVRSLDDAPRVEERKLSPHEVKQAQRPPSPKRAMQPVVAHVPSPIFTSEVEIEEAALDFPGTGVSSARPGVGMNFGPQGFQGSNIGRLFVKAKKLGVILDNSGSMSAYLEDLRSEIRRGFKGSIFSEVWGCRLEGISEQRETIVPGLIYHDPAAVIKTVRKMVEDDGVDAIYWFTDLKDGETSRALEELEEYLNVNGNFNMRVKFYVRSLSEKPSKELAEVIRRSGGEVEVGPIDG